VVAAWLGWELLLVLLERESTGVMDSVMRSCHSDATAGQQGYRRCERDEQKGCWKSGVTHGESHRQIVHQRAMMLHSCQSGCHLSSLRAQHEEHE
jgi:hypothetical protein